MNFTRTTSILCAVAATTMGASVWAASDKEHVSHHPAATASVQVAQATPAKPGAGTGAGMGMSGTGTAAMPGYADQMKAMQSMHDKMVAAKTPEERNALMAEQMKLMQSSMGMMGRMGAGAMAGKPGDMAGKPGDMAGKPGDMAGKPGDMAGRQSMMEQRMDMMQSMMQMMVDRVAPATK